MTIDERIKTFVQLGEYIKTLSEEKFKTLAESIRIENPWFTIDNIRMAVSGIIRFLNEKNLRGWLAAYPASDRPPRTIGLIMAGNIPGVGFHDLLCVLIYGDNALVKLSSKDTRLIRALTDKLIEITPNFADKISYVDQLKSFDAVVATGSDNTARYFEYYFGKYPHIIRKNRTSIAILDGKETEKDLIQLGSDVFSYFGLGCRNVSKLFVPQGFDFGHLLDNWKIYRDLEHHHKYHNNYHYQKSILLVTGVRFLDNGFVLLQENEKLVSPIAVLYYEYYNSSEQLDIRLNSIQEKLQCIVGDSAPASVKFGDTQFPALNDYADNVDTLKFLSQLA